jgi:nucleoside-diphosphate-sugar epimerase
MRERILIMGVTGTVGCALVHQLEGRHEIVPVGRIRGDYQVDITEV